MVLAAKVVGEVVEKYVEKEPVKSVANVKKRRRLLTDSDEEIVGRKVKKAKRSQVWTCTFCDKVNADAAAVALNSSSQTIPKVFDIFGKKTGRKGTYGCDFCQEKLKFKKDLPKHLLDVHQITKDSHSKYLRFDGACWTPILPQQLNITE